jgi:hypothetical protein
VLGQADVHGTHTIYDSMGRVTSTERRDNLVITVCSLREKHPAPLPAKRLRVVEE